MEEKKNEMKLELVHQPVTYKMVIPKEVEDKIRLLCREIHNVEWSGVLFYKINGSFEDKSLVITCVDLFQMDEGNGTYTEYDMSPDVTGYMVDHPELLDNNIYQGLVHSHNHMATFFSGTDTATLQSEGSDMNHFVSLIVNNAGKYTAGITRKVKSIQVVNEKFTYPTWDDKVMADNRTYTVEKEYIQWFNLDIEIEGSVNNFENEMLDRIKEIRKSKQKSRLIRNDYFGNDYDMDFYRMSKHGISSPVGQANKVSNTKYPLFDNKSISDDDPVDYDKYKVSDDTIDWMVKQTITCSIIIPNSSTIDIDKWVKSMNSLYSKRFNNEAEFGAFATNFVDFLTNYTEDPNIAKLDDTERVAILAYNVRNKLSTLPNNKWMDIWISLYDDYIL